MVRILVAAAVACVVGNALGGAPFLDLSYEAALKKSVVEQKPLFIDFYTTWCGPCKKLDRTTWKDEKVQAWLHEHTVPLKLNAEKHVPLSKRLKVRAYPTMVFLDGSGEPIGRLVGYVDAKAFLKQAPAALNGDTPLRRAREAFDAEPQSMIARLKLAQALARAEKNGEALDHYRICWVDGHTDPPFSGVRRSFLLSDLSSLARVYPAAAAEMQQWHDAAERAVAGGDGDYQMGMDWVALSKQLGRGAAERLRIVDAMDQGVTRNAVLVMMTDDLYETGRFLEYASARPLAKMLVCLEPVALGDDFPDRKSFQANINQRTAVHGVRDWEVYVAIGKPKDAEQIRKTILKLNAEGKVRGAFTEAANRLRERGIVDIPSEEVIAAWQAE